MLASSDRCGRRRENLRQADAVDNLMHGLMRDLVGIALVVAMIRSVVIISTGEVMIHRLMSMPPAVGNGAMHSRHDIHPQQRRKGEEDSKK